MFLAKSKMVLYSMFSVKASKRILKAIRFTDTAFMGFISGKVIDSAIIGVICYICCAIMRMPYVVLVSVIVAVTNIIPVFGPFIGAVPTALIILLVSPMKCLIYVIFIIVLQQIDGNIIGPKILGCAAAFESAAPSFHPIDLLIGVAGAAALRLMVYCKGKNAKKYRKGVEYGSARWGGPKDIAPYIDPNFDNNILVTQTERITMNNRPKDPKTARNKNVLVIGGSGSGKTRFFVKPNLMQCVSKDYPTSFVITDPKGYNIPR